MNTIREAITVFPIKDYQTADLVPVYCQPNFLLKEASEGRKRRIINRLTFGLFIDLLTVQYLWIARCR